MWYITFVLRYVTSNICDMSRLRYVMLCHIYVICYFCVMLCYVTYMWYVTLPDIIFCEHFEIGFEKNIVLSSTEVLSFDDALRNAAVWRVTVPLRVLLCALWNAHVELAAHIMASFVAFLSDSILLSELKLTIGRHRCLPHTLTIWSLKLTYEQLPVAGSTCRLNLYAIAWYLWILCTWRAVRHLFLTPEVLKLFLDFWKSCYLHYAKDSVCTPQTEPCASVRKTSLWGLCKETILFIIQLCYNYIIMPNA